MAEACRALDFPIVSGNVSLYNETEGRPILPTPAIGGVGVIDDIAKSVGSRLTQARARHRADRRDRRAGSASRSTCARRAAARKARRRRSTSPSSGATATSCAAQIAADRVDACHDVSDGGLLVALAEMAMAGGTGMEIGQPAGNGRALARVFLWRGSRPLCHRQRLGRRRCIEAAQAAGVPAVLLGYSGGASLVVKGLLSLPLSDIKAAHEAWLPGYMAATE